MWHYPFSTVSPPHAVLCWIPKDVWGCKCKLLVTPKMKGFGNTYI